MFLNYLLNLCIKQKHDPNFYTYAFDFCDKLYYTIQEFIIDAIFFFP